MPRIRTIKPEFWDSPSTAKASPWARLLFIAMWNWADDYGRGTANLKELEAFAFPNDTFPVTCSGNTVHFRDAVAEVSEHFDVTFYEVHGRPYYAIPTWEDHQRNERRAKESKYPGPDHPDALTSGYATGTDDARSFRATVAETPNISGTGTGEQGNRGTGEQTLLSDPANAEPDTTETSTDETPTPTPYPAAFTDFWGAYPRHDKKRDALAAWRRARKRATAAEIVAGAVRYRDDPNRDPAYTKLPTTWLNGDCWESDEIPERRPQGRAAPADRWRAAFAELDAREHANPLEIESAS